MESVINTIANQYKKKQVVDVRSGDSVKVHQKIREGGKERIQIFQGLVIRTSRKDSNVNRILVRRVASGIGVEKSFLLHSPLVVKIEVTKRSRVKRNYLTYMRKRTGKSTRLSAVEFDSAAVNTVHDEVAEAAEKQAKEEISKQNAEDAAQKDVEKGKEEAKANAAIEAREANKPDESKE